MRKTPEFEACFAELIRLPSVSSIDPEHDQGNRAVIDALADWFKALDFDVEIMSVKQNPEKCNLIAIRGEGKDGLIMSGHTDTVPYDASGWNTDPFKLSKKDDRYYGLGTADMKSYFPIILETLERNATTNYQKPIVVVATADEESTMSGARLIRTQNRQLGRYCIIGEPTGLRPIHAHKGIIVETIRIEGQSGHSSNPALGNSALEGMNDVINALRIWRDELQSDYIDKEFTVSVPTLNFGRIYGGDSPNRICAACELSLDIRMLPGMGLEILGEMLRNKIKETLADTGLKVSFNSMFDGVPPMQTPKESDIIKYSEEYTGQPSGSVAFGTEGPFYNDMGIETVILGPGDIDVAHQPNEYLQIERIEPMINILSKMLNHFCEPK